MPQPTTIEYIADLVIRRTLMEVGKGPELRSALERAYPFPDHHDQSEPDYLSVWERALCWYKLNEE